MLEALCEDVVRALVGHNRVDHVVLGSLDSAGEVLRHLELPPCEAEHQLEQPLPQRALVVLRLCLLHCAGGHNVRIGRGAQVGDGGLLLSVLHQFLDNSVHRNRHLHEERTVQVCVRSTDKLLIRVQTQQPRPDLGGLRQKVAPCDLRDLVVTLSCHVLGDGEDEGTRGGAGLCDEVLPDAVTVEVERNDVGTHGHQKREGTHGRRRAEEDEVLVGEVRPLRVLRDLEEGGAGGQLDDALADPLLDELGEVFAGKVLSVVWDGVRRGACAGALDGGGLEAGVSEACHGLREGRLLAVAHEGHLVVQVALAVLGNLEGVLVGLHSELDLVDDVLDIGVAPALRVLDPVGGGCMVCERS